METLYKNEPSAVPPARKDDDEDYDEDNRLDQITNDDFIGTEFS